MKVDLDYILWLADQTEETLKRVAPLVASVLQVEEEKVLGFVEYVGNAAEAVINTIKLFLEFPTVFGAPGEGLTDENGNLCPDPPCPPEYAGVVFALKAQYV